MTHLTIYLPRPTAVSVVRILRRRACAAFACSTSMSLVLLLLLNAQHLPCSFEVYMSFRHLGTQNISNHAEHDFIDSIMWVQTVVSPVNIVEIMCSP